MMTANTQTDNAPERCAPATGSAPPTPDEIRADPDRILELYDCCPKCGSLALEALTWKSIGSDDITVGCWECDWMLHPPQWTPPSVQSSVINELDSDKSG